MDVSAAYLNGELDEELYLLPPEAVPIEKDYCWQLKCSLYGLKQEGVCLVGLLVVIHAGEEILVLNSNQNMDMLTRYQ